jgi:hypothetical protein
MLPGACDCCRGKTAGLKGRPPEAQQTPQTEASRQPEWEQRLGILLGGEGWLKK